MGDWGKERYGSLKTNLLGKAKVDALEYYRERLIELRRLIKEEQAVAEEQSRPAAFITFKSRKAQVT